MNAFVYHFRYNKIDYDLSVCDFIQILLDIFVFLMILHFLSVIKQYKIAIIFNINVDIIINIS